jgi:hypothetical protein
MKYSILACLCFVGTFSGLSAQNLVFQKGIALKASTWTEGKALSVLNSADSSTSLFLIDNSSIRGLLVDKHLLTIDSLDSARPGSHRLAGSSQEEGNYSLYFSSSDHTEYSVATFDYAHRAVGKHTVKLPDLKKDEYAGAVGYRNWFFVFSVVKKTSTLRVYRIDGAGQYTDYRYDFQEGNFGPEKGDKLYDVFKTTTLHVIDNEVSNIIERTQYRNKLYCAGDNLFITLDNQLYQTWVITLDLPRMAATLVSYDQAKLDYGTTMTGSSASYIHRGVLYQLKLCPQDMVLQLHDLATGKKIRSFRATDKEEISFLNTPIILSKSERVAGSGSRELSETSQFLRKASKGGLGLCAWTTPAGIEVTVGCYQENTVDSTPFSMLPGIPDRVVQTKVRENSPLAHTFSRAVHFKSLLNSSTYEHQSGVLGRNVFDRMGEFMEGLDGQTGAELVLRRNQYCLLGYYHMGEERYMIRYFTY